MKTPLLLVLLSLVFVTTRAAEKPTPVPATASAPEEAAPKHYLIVVRLVPRLHDEKAWTEADNAAVGAHFTRLKEAVEQGKVVLAGRTEEPLDQTFGLIVFAAPDEAAAREFMNADPCIVAGVMTGTLHPYGLALMRK